MAVLTSIFIVMFVTHVLHFYNSCIERYGRTCIECTTAVVPMNVPGYSRYRSTLLQLYLNICEVTVVLQL